MMALLWLLLPILPSSPTRRNAGEGSFLESTWEMVRCRQTSSHQYFGIEKCLFINSSSNKRQTFNNSILQHGQHNCDGLHQSPGHIHLNYSNLPCSCGTGAPRGT